MIDKDHQILSKYIFIILMILIGICGVLYAVTHIDAESMYFPLVFIEGSISSTTLAIGLYLMDNILKERKRK